MPGERQGPRVLRHPREETFSQRLVANLVGALEQPRPGSRDDGVRVSRSSGCKQCLCVGQADESLALLDRAELLEPREGLGSSPRRVVRATLVELCLSEDG